MSERLSHRRAIVERMIIRGDLTLLSPTCLSSGDSESPTDLPLLKDSISERALLTGASLAGALRNFLWEYREGYGAAKETLTSTARLFGDVRSSDNDEGDQSPLIISDVVSQQAIPTIELRDGVKIKVETGTAEEGAKYDLELIAAGTVFPLYFELLIEERHDRKNLLEDLAIALHGLETGEIALGMKKRRGFGQCSVTRWQVEQFDLSKAQDRYAWLTHEHWSVTSEENHSANLKKGVSHISEALSALIPESERPLISLSDRRSRFELDATFALTDSLLIRAAATADSQLAPDVVQLMSRRANPDKSTAQKPVVSGTSLAGVLRNRAIRILNTLDKDISLVDSLFGPDFSKDRSKKPQASRLLVKESIVEDAAMLVQNRIAIDRFTGGALDGALFSEQALFSTANNQLKVSLQLRQPAPAEIGLLLLLLKDLWTGDLPVGGGSNIGRGRLQGSEATLKYSQPAKEIQAWMIEGHTQLAISDADALQACVQALLDHDENREQRSAA